ncbi:hypothetical protein, partial [Paenibacillus timonensis]|uniref:hypothetical protein n=1 Tax=Paenibacillus timonensis TaxID=225915 RepID=UPI0022DED738
LFCVLDRLQNLVHKQFYVILADTNKDILWPYLRNPASKSLVLTPSVNNKGNKLPYFAANS